MGHDQRRPRAKAVAAKADAARTRLLVLTASVLAALLAAQFLPA